MTWGPAHLGARNRWYGSPSAATSISLSYMAAPAASMIAPYTRVASYCRTPSRLASRAGCRWAMYGSSCGMSKSRTVAWPSAASPTTAP